MKLKCFYCRKELGEIRHGCDNMDFLDKGETIVVYTSNICPHCGRVNVTEDTFSYMGTKVMVDKEFVRGEE